MATSAITPGILSGGGDGQPYLFNAGIGSAATTWDLTFTEGVQDARALVMINNPIAGNNLISLYINDDTTATNYHNQRTGATNGTSVNNGEASDTIVSFMTASGQVTQLVIHATRISDGVIMRIQGSDERGTDELATVDYMLFYEAATPASILKFNLVSDQTNGLGANSTAKVKEF